MALLKIFSGALPVDVVIIILVVVSVVVSGINYKKIVKLEEHFINHLKNHAKKGGE